MTTLRPIVALLALLFAAPPSCCSETPAELLNSMAPGRVRDLCQDLLTSRDKADRLEAAQALEAMGRDADGGVRAIIKALRDDSAEVRECASRALVAIGKAAVPNLCATTRSALAAEREVAAAALGRVGIERDSASYVAVVRLLRDPVPSVREAALDALATKPLPQAVPEVVALIKRDKDVSVRDAAVRSLAEYTGDAREAVPVLMDLVRREQSIYAAKSLAWIGTPALPSLLAIGRDRGQTDDLRYLAIDTVRLMVVAHPGPETGAACGELVECLRDRRLAEITICVYANAREHGKAAVAALKKQLDDPDAEIGIRAAEAMRYVAPKDASSLSMIRQTLKTGNPAARRAAAQAIGNLGRNALEAERDVVDALKDSDSAVRERAAWALRFLSPTQSAIAALEGLIGRERDRKVLEEAATSLDSLRRAK
jgi:HEAT repeat protein